MRACSSAALSAGNPSPKCGSGVFSRKRLGVAIAALMRRGTYPQRPTLEGGASTDCNHSPLRKHVAIPHVEPDGYDIGAPTSAAGEGDQDPDEDRLPRRRHFDRSEGGGLVPAHHPLELRVDVVLEQLRLLFRG